MVDFWWRAWLVSSSTIESSNSFLFLWVRRCDDDDDDDDHHYQHDASCSLWCVWRSWIICSGYGGICIWGVLSPTIHVDYFSQFLQAVSMVLLSRHNYIVRLKLRNCEKNKYNLNTVISFQGKTGKKKGANVDFNHIPFFGQIILFIN